MEPFFFFFLSGSNEGHGNMAVNGHRSATKDPSPIADYEQFGSIGK